MARNKKEQIGKLDRRIIIQSYTEVQNVFGEKEDPKKAIKELKRELKMRLKVYPRWIINKKLHRDRANKQYLALKEALSIIEIKEGLTYKQTTLFPAKNNFNAIN